MLVAQKIDSVQTEIAVSCDNFAERKQRWAVSSIRPSKIKVCNTVKRSKNFREYLQGDCTIPCKPLLIFWISKYIWWDLTELSQNAPITSTKSDRPTLIFVLCYGKQTNKQILGLDLRTPRPAKCLCHCWVSLTIRISRFKKKKMLTVFKWHIWVLGLGYSSSLQL